MNKYFKAAVVLAPILTMSGCFPPGGGKALAADKVCQTMEQKEFLEVQKKYIKKGYYATPEELAVFLEKFNEGRIKAGLYKMEADTLYIANLGGDRIGFVAFKDNCIVPGMAIASQYGAMFAMLKSFGSEKLLLNIMDEL